MHYIASSPQRFASLRICDAHIYRIQINMPIWNRKMSVRPAWEFLSPFASFVWFMLMRTLLPSPPRFFSITRLSNFVGILMYSIRPLNENRSLNEKGATLCGIRAGKLRKIHHSCVQCKYSGVPKFALIGRVGGAQSTSRGGFTRKFASRFCAQQHSGPIHSIVH